MKGRWVLPGVVVVVIAAAAAAFLLGGGGPAVMPSTSPSGQASATPTDASTSAPSQSASVGVGGGPTIGGAPLPGFQGPDGDAAVGLAAPIVTGSSFDGSPVTLGESGRPQIIIFVAHWCPHCQREVPLIQSWLDANGPPDGVDLRSVATGNDPSLPNYPPETWLANEHWSVPVVVDPTNSIAAAYGLTSYPYFVFLDSKGRVAFRASGEIPLDTLQQLVDLLRDA
jgi:cytochrome c biogenesis protein CcmG, thiol:disulfide interchange protein DsbE